MAASSIGIRRSVNSNGVDFQGALSAALVETATPMCQVAVVVCEAYDRDVVWDVDKDLRDEAGAPSGYFVTLRRVPEQELTRGLAREFSLEGRTKESKHVLGGGVERAAADANLGGVEAREGASAGFEPGQVSLGHPMDDLVRVDPAGVREFQRLKYVLV